jgi:hypothetical protein
MLLEVTIVLIFYVEPDITFKSYSYVIVIY